MALTKVTMGLLKDLAAKVMEIMTNHSNIFHSTVKTATGVLLDFDIPAGVNRVTVEYIGVSTNGASEDLIQLGVGGVPQISGYSCRSAALGSGVTHTTSTAGIPIRSNNATDTVSGILTLCRATGNTWVASGTFVCNPTDYLAVTAGHVTLSGALNKIRATTINGTDQFDAGQINVSWEF